MIITIRMVCSKEQTLAFYVLKKRKQKNINDIILICFPIYFINLYYLNDNLSSGLLLDCCELIRKLNEFWFHR